MKAWSKNERFAVPALRLGRQRRLRGGLRKIGKAELVAVAHDNGAINSVLKLADITGPLELRQVSHRLAADAGDGAIFFGAESCEKMSQQMRDVLAAHPQRRNRQRQHMQAIEQIFAEMSAFDALQQLAVGCGDDAHVDLHRLARANPLDPDLL